MTIEEIRKGAPNLATCFYIKDNHPHYCITNKGRIYLIQSMSGYMRQYLGFAKSFKYEIKPL